MNRLFFVLNDLAECDFHGKLEKYLSGVPVDMGTELPATTSDYRLIILWSYRKIIARLPAPNNVILFHSSDLPEGRGWAPIYYSLAENKEYHVISGIFAAPKVDSGDIIVKAKFRIGTNCTASDLRRFDEELSILLLRNILDRFDDRPISGAPQLGLATYRRRRDSADNKIDVTMPFQQLIPHLRACEPSSPAYFEYQGQRYSVAIAASIVAELPKDIQIVFGEDGTIDQSPLGGKAGER